MTRQPCSDYWAHVGDEPTHRCWAREVAQKRFIPLELIEIEDYHRSGVG